MGVRMKVVLKRLNVLPVDLRNQIASSWIVKIPVIRSWNLIQMWQWSDDHQLIGESGKIGFQVFEFPNLVNQQSAALVGEHLPLKSDPLVRRERDELSEREIANSPMPFVLWTVQNISVVRN